MKVLVLSDSHGNLTNMVRAVEAESPHMIVHLGDGWREARQLHGQFPMLPFYQVPGNCDFRPSEPAEQLLFWEEKRVLICHLWRETVPASGRICRRGRKPRSIFIWPYPSASGGHAG